MESSTKCLTGQHPSGDIAKQSLLHLWVLEYHLPSLLFQLAGEGDLHWLILIPRDSPVGGNMDLKAARKAVPVSGTLGQAPAFPVVIPGLALGQGKWGAQGPDVKEMLALGGPSILCPRCLSV